MNYQSRKKIILAVTNDLTYDRRMIRICSSLANNYQVLLVGRRLPASKPLSSQPFKQKRLNLIFQKGKLFYIEYQVRLFFFLIFQPFDAVNAVDLDSILPCLLVSRLKNKPCAYDAHEYFTETPEVISRPFVQKIWERVALFSIPKMRLCYTVSAGLADVFEKRYGAAFETIRNVPPILSETEYDAKEKTVQGDLLLLAPKIILYQGALNEGRGIEYAISAMRDVEGAVLWLAGEGDLSAALRILADDLIRQGKVYFLGYLNPNELQGVTAKTHIGLNLLENKGLSYYYSLANKFFDYIHAGKPQITMRFPEYIFINDQYEVALLLDKIDTKELVKALNKLLTNERIYARLKKNCQKAALMYNWENEEKKLIRLYQDMLTDK